MTVAPDDTSTDLHAVIAELRAERDAALSEKAALAEALARRNSEFGERTEQQVATIDVLKVISASPGDALPVFELIVERARAFCEADIAAAALLEGDMLHLQAQSGVTDEHARHYDQQFPRPVDATTQFGRAILARDVVQTPDVRADPNHIANEYFRAQPRSLVAVPLLRGDAPIGALSLVRRMPGEFSTTQIELLKTFAQQAVIAITSAETYRALQERTAALAHRNIEYGERIEHQSATIDVLKAMSASPGDPQPVFDLIVDRARGICDAYGATVFEFDGTEVHWRAATGVSDDRAVRAAYEAQFPMVPTRDWAFGRAILDRRIIRIDDMEAEPGLDPTLRGITAKSNVTTPIMRGDAVIGAIGMGSREKGGFSDSQVELLKTFAEQAAIAITSAETYRALQARTSDLQETLEYQIATSDLLKVISRSSFDLQPVIDTVAETAAQLCDAEQAAIFRRERETVWLAANFGFPPEYEAATRSLGSLSLDHHSTTIGQRASVERRPVHIHDVAAVPGYWDVAIKLGRQRTSLAVPFLRGADVVGHIVLARQRVEPFTDRQIELVSTFADQAVIAIENTRLMTEQREALEQQTATAEVLAVINASPGDLAPVFDAILEKVLRLCNSAFGVFSTYNGTSFHIVAARGVPDDPEGFLQRPHMPLPGLALTRVVQGEDVVQIADITDDEAYRQGIPDRRFIADVCGGRTQLLIALRKDKSLLGMFNIFRQEVRPFGNRQIELLRGFAAQAVIAMENARLLTEQREALEQQTATAEVLQVINANPGDLTPVFDAILDKAHTLCGAVIGSLVLFDGTHFRAVATHGLPEQVASLMRHPVPPNSRTQELIDGMRFRQIEDIRAIRINGDYPIMGALVEYTDMRTVLFVPLRKDGALLGFISAYRPEVRAFSDKEIALLENFAAQAVIATENARLLTEQREALEQHTATAEVLQVINASPGNLAPVFDVMLQKAMRLCEASFGSLWTLDGDRFRPVAHHGLPLPYAEYLSREVPPAGPGTGRARLLAGAPYIQILDLADDEPYRNGEAHRRAIVDLGGARTALLMSLRRDDVVLGLFMIYRKEVRPFSDKQIALAENFAAQAVIAMENARLLIEQREALEQQTATAEVLRTINENPGNLGPVFDVILEKALSLAEAAFGTLWIYHGDTMHAAATRGMTPALAEFRARNPVLAVPPVAREASETRSAVQMLDIRESESYRAGRRASRAIADLGGARTNLVVPLLKVDEGVGCIQIYRQEVRVFTPQQIALLEGFAAQAVIAMENARLLTEQREALEQQTGTAEVLQVINSSPGDLAPVFDAMLERATRLCEAPRGQLATFDGEYFRFVAVHGDTGFSEGQFAQGATRPEIGVTWSRIVAGEEVVQIVDVADTDLYRAGHEGARRFVDVGRGRTVLTVALRKDDLLLGALTVYRQEVRSFSNKQIALLRNFAAQAVIAMENARLLTEQREALEQQTATAEVLQVINASPGNLAPVFDAMLEKAMRLCDAAFGGLTSYDGEQFDTMATRGLSPQLAEVFREPFIPQPGSFHYRLAHGERLIHGDHLDNPSLQSGQLQTRGVVEIGGARTGLVIALQKEDWLIGSFWFFRREVRPFSDKQIALLRNFADQAVIAMENARLLTETREALEQQTATAEVLQVINASPGNLTPVFDAMLVSATRLCEAPYGLLSIYDGEFLHYVAVRGEASFVEEQLGRGPLAPSAGLTWPSILAGESTVHLADVRDSQQYRIGHDGARRFVDGGIGRTVLSVALRKDDVLLGVLTLYREEVRAFTNKQIALLQNFAAQAVIAMENARLLNEVRQRQEELRITFENMGDGVALFDDTRHLVASNQRFQHMLDVPDDVIASRPTFSDYIRYLADHGEYGPEPEDHVQQLLALGSQRRTFERTRPNGRIIEIRVNPVPGGGFVVIYSDITDRKRNEEEIRAARDAAEEASRTIEGAYRDLKAAQANLIQAEKMASLGQLTAGIAHEIKNPLNFVNNFAALSVDLLSELKETAASGFAVLSEKQRAEVDDVSAMLTSNLEKITEHGKRADGIVKAMLEHSRGSSGERRMVDLNALIDEALNLAYHGARAQDQSFNITLERHFAAGVAPIELAPQDMTRVFLNLFSNGFYAATRRARQGSDAEFMPTLKVTTRDVGDAVEVRVRDNGIGISADIRDKLFQPFFTTKPTGEGTGLGLSITYDIVTQQHGGSIAVDSKVGEYSEFTIRLPRKPQVLVTPSQSEDLASTTASQPEVRAVARRLDRGPSWA